MANPFAITTTTNHAPLGAARRGAVVFNVSNAAGVEIEGRALIHADDPSTESWLQVEGEAERAFKVKGTEQVTVHIAPPEGAAPGRYAFRLDVVGVESPDEQYSEGPAVTFDVAPPPPPPRPFPWWIAAAGAAVVIVVLAIVLWPRRVTLPEVAGQPRATAEAMLVEACGNRECLEVAIVRASSVRYDAGEAIAILPEAGTRVRRGSTVSLTLSTGPDVVAVPDVAGMALGEATSLIEGARLHVGEHREIMDPAPVGQVLGSEPQAGQQVAPDTRVALIVSSGLSFGTALALDGVDDHVRVAAGEALETGDEFTWELWIRPAPGYGQTASGHAMILSREDEAGASASLSFSGEGYLAFAVRDAEQFSDVVSPEPLPADAWSHIAAVRTVTTLRLYVNGDLVSATSRPVAPRPDATDLWIGRGTEGGHLRAQIDELRVWNARRSEPEIEATMRRPLRGDEADLVGYWRFDEGEGSAAADATGRGGEGALSAAGKEVWFTSALYIGAPYGHVDLGIARGLVERTNKLTIEAWIRPDTVEEGAARRILTSERFGRRDGYGFGLLGSRLRFTTFDVRDYDTAPGLAAAGEWQHVAATLDDRNQVTFYVNGANKGTIGHDRPAIPNTDDKLVIGMSNDPQADIALQGAVAEVRVWSVDRTEAQIRANMNRPVERSAPGLEGYWRFDEADPESILVQDASPNDRDGLIKNGPLRFDPTQGPGWVPSGVEVE